MKFFKCSKRQKRVVFMIIILLISYYIFIGSYASNKNNSSKYVGRDKQTYGEYFLRYFGSNWQEKPRLASRLTNLFSKIKLVNIKKLLNWGDLSPVNDELYTKKDKNCKYLFMLLNPWDLPNECISEESDEQKFNNDSPSIIILEHDPDDNPWRHELYKQFLEKISGMKAFEDHISLARLGEGLGAELAGFFKVKNFPKEAGEDYLSRLLDISLDLEFSDNDCKRNVNIRKLWEFGRLYSRFEKNGNSSVTGGSKYYREFLAFVYYKCIYGIESSSSAYITGNIKEGAQSQYLLNHTEVGNETVVNQEDSFFEIIACYQLIPTLGVEDNELVSLGNLCEWEFERKDFYVQNEIDQEKIRLIRQHINQINEIYSKLDIIQLNYKYEQNLANTDELEDLKTSYFNQLILIIKKISKQVMIQYTYIYDEIGSLVDSSRKIDKNNETKTPSDPGNYSIATTTVLNSISDQNKQNSDSLDWKQLMSSIIENTQNILVREHINTMLINFLFDAIIRMLSPWISLFYQASFIINSYLSIISFLLVIVAILVCFNTIPCFRSEKDEEKSQKLWAKVLRIYKASVMVLLLNTIFILGGLLRYLYLPNEIELLNANITIIKAVNKVLNIILCPCVVNIITSFSTVFSIFQWQLIWISRKLSFSSLINL
ncbi:uncharacterized protein cubi_00719 [Cryptosporidium ubiquitum]|uniref:Uncharacterized protein n=1 Tax=Cryptosporidium ubiquitum TaxID=857276 RepID=A0A1J4MD50_9CRYT|nr:uncharacterized protein cubi_00719 [Cryptosporidium ubiquitum]OII71911.1 hypothetical protein cubi_00719 [Cryptosporidium ubiquitum]